MKLLKFALIFSTISLFTLSAMAAVPHQINFQGVLKDSAGTPVSNGSYSVTFTIYDALSAGTSLWTETQSVTTSNGLFTVQLGIGPVPIADSIFNDSTRYLGIKIGADPEITPRQRLSSVGYSYVSSQWNSADSNLYRVKGSVGIGTAAPAGVKLAVTTSNFIGIYSTGGSYGIDARGSSVGVLGYSTGFAAVQGNIGGNFGTYGGYFQGDVKVERNLVVAGDIYVSGKIETSPPWTSFPFAAGFDNAGGPYQHVQYRKIGDMVYIRGYIFKTNFTTIVYQDIFGTLPVGFRPPAYVLCAIAYGETIIIRPNGEVISYGGSSSIQVLDGIFFSTTP